MKPDDPNIGNGEVLLRYSPSIPHQHWTVTDQATKQTYITLAALKWDADGISCYRQLILQLNELDWSAVKREHRNGVFSLVVEHIRDEGLGVTFDPLPEAEEPHPRRVAHTLIVDCDMPKKPNKAARERLALKAKIIHFGSDY